VASGDPRVAVETNRVGDGAEWDVMVKPVADARGVKTTVTVSPLVQGAPGKAFTAHVRVR
jgi:hypothetical protein